MSDTKLLPKTITNSKMTKSYLLESDPYLKTSTKTSSPFVLSTNNNNNNSNGNSTMMIGCNELEHQFIRSNWGNLGATSNLTLGPVAETNESTMTTTNNTSSTTSTTNPTTINYNQYSHLNGIPHELISDYQRPLVKPLALHNVPSNVPPIAYINGNSVRPIRTRHYSQQQTAFLHNQQPQNNGTNGNSGSGNDNNNSQNNNHNINGETSSSKKLNSGNFKVVVAPGDTQHYGLASSDIKKSVKIDNSSRTLTSGSSNVMMEASKGVESSQGTTLNVCSNNNNNNHNTSSTSTMLAPIKSKIKVQSMPIAIQHQQQQQQQSSQDKAMQAKPKQSSYYNSKQQQKQQQSALNLASPTTTSTTTTAMTSTSTSASVRDYVTNNDYESSIYSLYENTEQVIEFMAKRMNSILRQAKENRRLVCTELLVPHMLLAQIASDVIQMSECEPCGLRGCLLYICIEDTGAYGGGGSGSGSHHAKQHPKSSTSSISSFSSSSSNCSSSSSSSSSNHSSFSSCSSSTCSSSSDSHHHSYHPNHHHSHPHHQPQPPCSHPHHQGSIYSNQQQHQYHLQQQAQPLASRLLGEFAIDRNVVPTFEVFLTLKRATPNWFESLEIKLLGKERIVLSEVYLLHKKKLYQPSSPTL